MDNQDVEEVAVMREVLGPKMSEKRNGEKKESEEKKERVDSDNSECDGYEIYE